MSSDWTSATEALYGAFVLFEETLEAARSDLALAAAARAVELEAREQALACWGQLFGTAELASSAHRAYLLRWNLKGLSALRDHGVLSQQDWLAASRKLALEWQELGSPSAAYDFEKVGPDTAGFAPCRRLYLLHRLFLAVDEMADEGLIPDQARAAALENLRLRTPRYWQTLFPDGENGHARNRRAGLARARKSLAQLGEAGKLDAAHLASLQALFAEQGELAPGSSGAPPAAAPGAPPVQVPVAPVAPDGGAAVSRAREIRTLERLELPLRKAASGLAPRVRAVLLSLVRDAREDRWRELVGEEKAPEEGLTPDLLADLDARLARRLSAEEASRASGSLRALAGQPPVAASPWASPPGPDPAGFDPSFAPDLVRFAADEEDRERSRRFRAAASRRPEVSAPRPAPARRWLALDPQSAIPALLGELSIHWLLFLGAFLVLGGGLILTFSVWSEASAVGRYAPLFMTTVFFHALSELVERVFGLKRSAGALAWIALLFLPLNGLAAGWMGLVSSAGGAAGAAAAGLILLALSVHAAVRVLAQGESGASAAAARELALRLWGACALTAVWPAAPELGPYSAAAGLASTLFLLVPAIRGVGHAAPARLAFSGCLALAAHLAFVVRTLQSPGLAGILLLGAMHLAEVTASELGARGEEAGDLPVLARGASKLAGLLAAVLLLVGGLAGNRWLVAGLLYAAWTRAQAYAARPSDVQLALAFSALKAAELLTLYLDPAVYDLWSRMARALVGANPAALVLPELFIGLGSTVAALALARRPGRAPGRVAQALHFTGALTSLVVALAAIPAGAPGLWVGGVLLGAYGLLAVSARMAYMAAVALWAALTMAGELLVAREAPLAAWGLSGAAACWALAAIGRAGFDEWVRGLDPWLAGKFSAADCAVPVGWLSGLAVVSEMRAAAYPWLGFASLALLAGFFAHLELPAGEKTAAASSRFWLYAAFAQVWLLLTQMSKAPLNPLAPSTLILAAACSSLTGAALGGRSRAVAAGFHAFGAATLCAAAALLCRALWVAPAVFALALVLTVALRYAYLALVAVWSGLAATAGFLWVSSAPVTAWYTAWIAWLYALALTGELGLDAWMARLDPIFVGKMTLAGASMPLAWLTALVLYPQAFAHQGDPWFLAGCILLLAAFFTYRAIRGQDEAAAWGSVAGPLAAYVHLKANGVLPNAVLTQLVAIVLSYPLLVLARGLGGRLRIYRLPLRAAALALPSVVAAEAAVVWEGARAATLVGAAGVFYTLAPLQGEARALLYLAGFLFNAANFLYWRPYHPSTGLYWSVPAGLTLIGFTHLNKDLMSREVRGYLRLAGSLLISGESLWGSVANAEPVHALVLAVIAVFGVLAGLHFRVKDYLVYSTLLLVIDAGSFVVRQIIALSRYGVGALIAGGLVLIALAAAFERGRTTLVRQLERLRSRLEEWE